MPIRTVTVPAAEKRTGLRPVTGVTVKELPPLHDCVIHDYATNEAVGMGAKRIVPALGTGKNAVQACLSGRVGSLSGPPAPGMGSRPQLTEAIAAPANSAPVDAFRLSGIRHDCVNHDRELGALVAQGAIARQEIASVPLKATHSDTSGAGVCAMLLKVKVPGQAARGALAAASVDTQ